VLDKMRRGASQCSHHQTRFVGGHCAEIGSVAARLMKNGLDVPGELRAKPWSPRLFFIPNGNKELNDERRTLRICGEIGSHGT